MFIFVNTLLEAQISPRICLLTSNSSVKNPMFFGGKSAPFLLSYKRGLFTFPNKDGIKGFNFICENGHTFEAMVPSIEAFEEQKKNGFFTCPVCNSNVISRALSAPHIQASSTQKDVSQNTVEALHTVYKTVKKILDESEFVGDRFADEARSIHRGDAPDRLITGTPTSEEVSELRDEGIEVLEIGLKKDRSTN